MAVKDVTLFPEWSQGPKGLVGACSRFIFVTADGPSI